MNRLLLSISVVLSTMITQSHAAKPKKMPEPPEFVNTTEPYKSEILNEEYYKKLMAQPKAVSRKVSGKNDTPKREDDFADDFWLLRAKLIGGKPSKSAETEIPGVKSPEDLETVIQFYSESTEYNKLSPQSKMVVIQLQSLVPFKSFFYRAQTYFKNGTAVRSAIVTMLRNSSTGIQTFFPVTGEAPTNHWEIVFRYMTEPMEGMGPIIKTDFELQSFVYTVINSNGPLIKKMEEIYKNTEEIWWDNKLYMSFANFTDDMDRYTKLGKPEMEAILSTSFAAQSSLRATAAYSFSGLSDSILVASAFFGMEQVSNSFNFVPKTRDNVMGLKSRDRFQTLRKFYQDRGLFRLNPKGGKTLMSDSYDDLVSSVGYARASWNSIQKLGDTKRTNFLVDPQAILPYTRILNTSLETVEKIIRGESTKDSTSVIQGEIVQLNLKALYTPEPPASLTMFYPVAFDNGPEKKTDKKINGVVVEYRNYKQGSPIAWDASTYSKYFSDLETAPCPANTVVRVSKCTTQVGAYARILSQTWGGGGFGAIISSMVF